MKRENIVQLLILLLSIILILFANYYPTNPSGDNVEKISINTVLLSIGCSILAVVIINFVEYHITLPEVNFMKVINSWKLVSIFKTRQEMNTVTNKLLLKSEELDIAALGASGFINYQGDVLKERLKKGLKIRFLIPHRESNFISQREKDEMAQEGSIKKAISDLVEWVETTKKELNLSDSAIQIREYSCLPIDSIMRIDNNLFTGPFMVKKKSQLTMSYQYKKGGDGYEYYNKYFEDIWNDVNITNPVKLG
ncbi:TPA: hypothetical protein N2935_000339 [Vibrio parahaemolyticus]|nr:hypothetical protein [Vibrio alginolyticus]ELA8091342.1 hypothetical protein [Vibrio parahaemolyticus]MDF4402816.1 hypothetical protein [Vibrio parahaemolyticus]MDF4606056.1 hypothetical protein [Vibrio parahaemolyticus]HCG5943341.1 hypothetical protein [Vibrio parahaemolyticus]